MGRIFGGCLLWVIAGAVFVYGCYHLATKFQSEFRPFLAPGHIETVVESTEGAALPVTLWYDHETTFDGRSFSTPEKLGGTKFRAVEDLPNGKAYPLSAAPASTTMNLGNTNRRLVGSFELKPGKYRIEVAGIKEQCVFSLGPNPLKLFGSFAVVTGISALFGLLGLIAVILGIVKIVRGNKQPPQDQGGSGGGLLAGAGPLLAGGALAAGGAALMSSDSERASEDFFRSNPSDETDLTAGLSDDGDSAD